MSAHSENVGVCEGEYELVSVCVVCEPRRPLLFRNMSQHFTVACVNWGCPSVGRNYTLARVSCENLCHFII